MMEAARGEPIDTNGLKGHSTSRLTRAPVRAGAPSDPAHLRRSSGWVIVVLGRRYGGGMVLPGWGVVLSGGIGGGGGVICEGKGGPIVSPAGVRGARPRGGSA